MANPAPVILDTVIVNATIVTMNAERDILDGWIGIAGGRIQAIGTGDAPSATTTIDARGGIVHPGYVSAHQHTMDTLGRASVPGQLPFFDWLFGTYYGGVLAYSVEDARTAATLAATDLRRAGVTTLLDCWGVGDPGGERSRASLAATIDVARASGLRWIIAPMVADTLPDAWASDLSRMTDDTFRPDRIVAQTGDALQFARDSSAQSDGLVDVWVSPELPEMATDELLSGLSAIAAASGTGFTTHINAAATSGANERGIDRLERLGVLAASRFVAAHVANTTDAERRLLADRHVGVVHCPTSSMMGGAARSVLGELRASGVATALGLDNATLNFPADMVAEMRAALQFDRVASSGPDRLTAHDALALATIEGARVLGIDDRVGSLEVGKEADLVVLDTSGSHWQPGRSADLGIVLQSRADDIRRVLVAGAEVYADPRA